MEIGVNRDIAMILRSRTTFGEQYTEKTTYSLLHCYK